VYETLERPWSGVLGGWSARHLDRPQVAVAIVADSRRPRRGSKRRFRRSRRAGHVGSPKQIGAIIFGKMGLPGGSKDQTGACPPPRRCSTSLRAGPDFSKKDSGRRQVSKTEIDYTDALPTYVHPQTHRVHNHLRAGGDRPPAAVVERAEPAEHSGATRTAERFAAPFIATPGHKLGRRIIRRSNCGCLAEIADIRC